MATLRAINIFQDSNLKIIALASLDFQYRKTDLNYHCYVHLEPIAIIVSTPNGITVLDMDSEIIRIDRLSN